MRCWDQGAHIRERLTANRSDLTLQGGPNQTRHAKAPSDPTHQPFPSPPRTTEPPHLLIVSRAQRETTKSKYMHPISPRLLDYPRRWDGVLYFRSEAVIGLPISTTSYSQHAVSTVQTRSTGPDNEWSLTDTDGAKHSPPGLKFLSFPSYSIFHSFEFIKTSNISWVTRNYSTSTESYLAWHAYRPTSTSRGLMVPKELCI